MYDSFQRWHTLAISLTIWNIIAATFLLAKLSNLKLNFVRKMEPVSAELENHDRHCRITLNRTFIHPLLSTLSTLITNRTISRHEVYKNKLYLAQYNKSHPSCTFDFSARTNCQLVTRVIYIPAEKSDKIRHSSALAVIYSVQSVIHLSLFVKPDNLRRVHQLTLLMFQQLQKHWLIFQCCYHRSQRRYPISLFLSHLRIITKYILQL